MNALAARTALVFLFAASVTLAPDQQTLSFARFGTVHLYRQAPEPSAVVLFVSGDGGWNLGVVDMARDLATLDALVVGIDITHYLAELARTDERCAYPASDFEALGQFVQKRLAFPRYITPVLVGYSSGATLVYAVLVQAPPGTFRGALSLGFCPDLPLVKPLCRGQGLEWTTLPKGKGYSFLPATELEVPWVALQGTTDQVCDPSQTEAFVRQVPQGRVIVLPKVGHGFSVPRNWLPQFRQGFLEILRSDVAQPTHPSSPSQSPPMPPGAADAGPDVSDLPLVEVPAAGPGDELAIVISGDGGWTSLDREVGTALAAQGVAVVGLDSLRYFWARRSPEAATVDLGRIVRHYLASWKRERLLLVGYSRGADVLPFMARRLPAELREHVALVALLGPAHRVDFEFHLSDWLGGGEGSGLPTLPEVQAVVAQGAKVMCVYGEGETDTICPDLPQGPTVVRLSGGHHFGSRYDEIAARILEAVRTQPR
jgi:type IV secretory pathway VirJ component